MPEYRAVPEGRRAAFERMRDYAFAPQKGEQEYESESDFPTDLSSRRGLFEDEELLAICSYFDFEAALEGERVHVGGVSSVASPPENRRDGLVTRLLTDLLTEFRAEGIYLSALWPFAYEFYERHGWAPVQKHARYEFDPEAVAVADENPLGEFRAVDADEYEALAAVYEQAMDGYALATARDEDWWRHRIFDRWQETPYVYVWERDGEPRGYLTYSVKMLEEETWSRELRVHELMYADYEALEQLLRFCYYHDSQVDNVVLGMDEETAVLDMVPDPRALTCTVRPGVMFRLVDVPAALERRPYPADLTGEFTVAVEDDLLDWNDGTFRVTFEDGAATCTPVETETPDVRTDVNGLSQRYVGYLDPETAEALSAFTVENGAKRDLLSVAFPERDVYLPEAF